MLLKAGSTLTDPASHSQSNTVPLCSHQNYHQSIDVHSSMSHLCLPSFLLHLSSDLTHLPPLSETTLQ